MNSDLSFFDFMKFNEKNSEKNMSDYSSDENEDDDELTVRQSHSKLPIVIFTPEIVQNRSKVKVTKKCGEKYQLRFKFQRGGTALIRNMLTGFGFRECSETSLDYNILWLNSHVKFS